MGVFENIEPNLHINSIRQGAEALTKLAREIVSGRPWSICELELSDDDLRWLECWAGAILGEQARLNLRYDERLPGIGILLLALASERCRRDSRERAIYDVFYDIDWQVETQHQLFDPTGYPRNRVRQAIEVACRTYGLRHAFDSPTTKPWYLTIKLQFGFTLAGARDQLEHWLVGTQPDAIEWLLQGEPTSLAKGTSIVSESFKELWSALLLYRSTQSQRHLHSLTQVLAQSPWVKPDWTETLIAASVRPVGGVVTINHANFNANATKSDEATSEEEPEIVTAVRVVWNDDGVQRKAAYAPRLLESLQGDCYFVSMDGTTIDVLRRNQERGYGNLDNSLEITLPLDRDNVLLCVADADGRGVCAQTIANSDCNSDFTVFNASGRLIANRKLDPEHGYTLQLPSKSKFFPESDLRSHYEDSRWCWVQLKPGWSPQATLQLPGDPEGFSLLVDKQDEVAGERLAEVFQNAASVVVDGQSFRVQLSCQPDTEVVGLRIDGFSVGLTSTSRNLYLSDPVSLSSIRHDGKIQLRLLVKLERLRVVRFSLTVERLGLLILHGAQWRSHPDGDAIDSSKLSRTQCVIHPGPTHREEGWTLMEGSRHVRMRPGRPIRLSELGCRGWPLFITDHQYNFSKGAKKLKLSNCVVDHGVVIDGLQLPGSGLVCFDLLEAIDLSEDHHLVLWTMSGRLVNFGHESIRREPQRWTVDPSSVGIEGDDPVVAGAVAFRGARLGSWWGSDWWRPVTKIANYDDAASVASCLRWFALPLIQREDIIAAAATEFGAAFFEQWCQFQFENEFGPTARLQEHRQTEPIAADLLVQDDDEIGWFTTVRRLLDGWQPTTEEVRKIVPKMHEREGMDSIGCLVAMMSSSIPMIVSRFVSCWIGDSPDPSLERGFRSEMAKPLLQPLRQRLEAFEQRDHQYEHERHGLFQPHPDLPWIPLSGDFIESLSVHDTENFEAIHNHSDLCRYLAAKLICNSTLRECQQGFVRKRFT